MTAFIFYVFYIIITTATLDLIAIVLGTFIAVLAIVDCKITPALKLCLSPDAFLIFGSVIAFAVLHALWYIYEKERWS